MTTEWSNKKPTEDGYYWLLTKTYIDDFLDSIDGPEITAITLPSSMMESQENSHIDIAFIGDDCGGIIPNKDIMITEEVRPRELIFMFDDKEHKGIIDLITRKEYLLIKIEEPEMPED